MSRQALLERLSGQFVLTADGMRAASERQKTLRNAIDWSYNLLSAAEQKLFEYLSVFSGGFALLDAEAIFGHTVTEKSVPELPTLLLDKSLIRRAANEAREDRYEMLVTIREYALERLGGSGGETEIHNRHLAHFLDLAQKADKELYGHNQLEWLSRLRATREKLRAALDWVIEIKQTKTALQMALKLDWFWHICSDHVEAAQSLLRVLALPDVSVYPEAHAEALAQLQHHKHLLGDHFATQIEKSGVASYAEQALAIARAADPDVNVVIATGGTGVTGRDGTPEAVAPLLDKVLDGFGEMFRSVSYSDIRTSTLPSRALAGVANGTYVFCVPASSGACATAWDALIAAQLDVRTRPCNLLELMPRLTEK